MIRFGKLTEAAIGFDFDEISRDCPMKDLHCSYPACEMIHTRCGVFYKDTTMYPYENKCNETNCILMHLLRVIGPMLLK